MAYYGYGKKDEKLDTHQIVNTISSSYYQDQIDTLETRISNISLYGIDEAKGVVYHSAESFKSQRDREKQIEDLKRQIEKHKEKIREVSALVQQLNSATYEFERITEKDALYDALRTCLDDILTYKEKTEQEIKRTPSETHERIFKGKITKRSKFRKLNIKDVRELSHSREKISKKVYEQLKKNKNKVVSKRYYGLENLLKENGYSLQGFAGSMYYETRQNYYGYPYNEKISELGVNISDLKEAEKIMQNPNYLESFGCDTYRELKYFTEHYFVASKQSQIYSYRNKFEELYILSRETEAFDYIVSAFSRTAIASSDSFVELRNVLSKQRKELRELENKLRKDYEKSKVRDIIESQKRLEALYEEYISKVRIYNNLENDKDYNDSELTAVRDEISQIRWEMISIVKKYPDLNKPEYNIDLEKFKKRTKDIEDEMVPKKKETSPVVEKPIEETFTSMPKAAITNEDPVVSHRPVSEEPRTEDKFRIGRKQEEKEESVVRVETPDHLRDTRTAYYNNYMVEKMKKTELGKLKFSEYLEKVAPFQKELIEVEKEREARAATVYKLYLKYLASLEDKTYAMRFSEFAQMRYGFEPSDIPIEYDEMENQIKLS